MRATLEDFLKRISDLLTLLKDGARVEEHLKSRNDPALAEYLRVRRTFDYAGLVVLLYAHFEQFVENLVWSYADAMSKNLVYVKLPEGLKTRHLEISVDLLARKRIGSGRYENLTELGVVRNLFECAHDNRPANLTREALVHHERNLRADVITDLFAGVGINDVNARACKADALMKWAEALEGSARPIPTSQVAAKLNRLVDLRNDIAHRGTTDDITTFDNITELVIFVEAYGRALHATVVTHHLRTLLKDSSPLTITEGPLKEGRVVVVTNPPVALRKWQAVCAFAGDPNTDARWGYVESLQINDEEVDEAPLGAAEVGLMLTFECFKNTALHPLAMPDPLLWPPPASSSNDAA